MAYDEQHEKRVGPARAHVEIVATKLVVLRVAAGMDGTMGVQAHVCRCCGRGRENGIVASLHLVALVLDTRVLG